METFKYRLEKYHGRESRYTCPKCERPHSFARYVDEEGRYIADHVGRCNREDKCGYHLTPAEYFRSKGIDYQPVVKEAPKPLPPTDYIPEQTMVRTLKTDNFLIRFLSKYFQPLELAYAIDKYRIGDAKDGRVIYWQIDDQDRVRTGKIMRYDPNTGHRIKNERGSFDWAHRYMKQPFQLEQCLFGLHLIKEGKPIAIAESEKSAVIASLTIPNYTWMATGGKGNFRLMEAVRGRDVTLFPDLGAYDQWSEHAARYGFKISRLLEDMATDEERKNGLDIADYILKIKENERPDNKVA
jgi:hypothetical protein